MIAGDRNFSYYNYTKKNEKDKSKIAKNGIFLKNIIL